MRPRSTSAFRMVRGKQVPRLAQGGGLPAPAAERFARLHDSGPGCNLWRGCTNSRGYGCFAFGGKGKTVLAHRFAYELHVGPIPEGMTIDHLCRNRLCVCPSHLDPCSAEENIRRHVRAKAARRAVADLPLFAEAAP